MDFAILFPRRAGTSNNGVCCQGSRGNLLSVCLAPEAPDFARLHQPLLMAHLKILGLGFSWWKRMGSEIPKWLRKHYKWQLSRKHVTGWWGELRILSLKFWFSALSALLGTLPVMSSGWASVFLSIKWDHCTGWSYSICFAEESINNGRCHKEIVWSHFINSLNVLLVPRLCWVFCNNDSIAIYWWLLYVRQDLYLNSTVSNLQNDPRM